MEALLDAKDVLEAQRFFTGLASANAPVGGGGLGRRRLLAGAADVD
jgi:hypothetical protein